MLQNCRIYLSNEKILVKNKISLSSFCHFIACIVRLIIYDVLNIPFCFSKGDRKRKNSTEERAVPVKNGKRSIDEEEHTIPPGRLCFACSRYAPPTF